MSEKQKDQNYQRALELVKRGDNQQALQCLLQHLDNCPENPEVLNDIGAVCYCMGKNEQAIEYLEKAKKLDPQSGEICWNLTEAYLAANMPSWAVGQFKDIERFGLANFDLYNRAARLFVDKNDKASAIEMLLSSLQIAPNQDLLYPMIDVLKSKRPNIAFYCESQKSIETVRNVMDFFAKRFNVSYYNYQNSQPVQQTLNHSNIAWFQSVSNMLVDATNSDCSAKIIACLTIEDFTSDLICKVDWNKVDNLIISAPPKDKAVLFEKLPLIEMQTSVSFVPNGVDMDKFPLSNTTAGKNILCLDEISEENNPMLLVQCMQKLHYIDPEYRLFFTGGFANEKIEKYMRYTVRKLDLDGTVIFDNCTLELSEILKNKHFITTAKIWQKQTNDILAAMSAGLKPVIHDCPQADRIFEDEYLFDIAEQFCNIIISENYCPDQYRQFIAQWHNQQNQMDAYNKIVNDIEKMLDKKTGISTGSINGLTDNLKQKLHPSNTENLIAAN